MREDFDWTDVKRALEAGLGIDEAAQAFGVACSAVNAKVLAYDWGGHETRRRRNKTVRMLLKAGAALAGAEDAAAVEMGAKRLAALSGMAKALRMFDGGAAEAPAMESIEEARASALRMREMEAEVERLIEERVQERLAARDAE